MEAENIPQTSIHSEASDLSEYKLIRELADTYPDLLSENRIRNISRNREKNGFADAFVQLGDTMLVHVPTFKRKLDEKRERGG